MNLVEMNVREQRLQILRIYITFDVMLTSQAFVA